MTLIILPVKNEAEKISETLSDLVLWCESNLEQYNILFIDDWSTDETFNKLKNNCISNEIRVISNQFDRGKGSALKAGYIYATYMYGLQADDDIIFMDSDGQIDHKDITTLLNLRKLYNADVVIGNKRHPYSLTKYTLQRKIISRTYNHLIRFLFKIRHEDTQCGIKIFRKRALDKVISRITCKRYAFDLELIIALRNMNIRVVDAPVIIKKQTNVGSVRIGSIIKTFIDTIIIYMKMKRGYYNG